MFNAEYFSEVHLVWCILSFVFLPEMSEDLKEAKFYFNMMMSSTFLFVYVCVCVFEHWSRDLGGISVLWFHCQCKRFWCCPFISGDRIQPNKVLPFESEYWPCSNETKSSAYLNKHLIPEIQFHWTLFISQTGRKRDFLPFFFPNTKVGASLLGFLGLLRFSHCSPGAAASHRCVQGRVGIWIWLWLLLQPQKNSD